MLLLIATAAHANESVDRKLVDLRQLSSSERALAFSKLERDEKIELFFQSNRHRPPYSGLNEAIGKEGKNFFVQLRDELDARGGTPEVLSFMVIVSEVKRQGRLSSEDMKDLRVAGICHLARQSRYCPELEAKLVSH